MQVSFASGTEASCILEPNQINLLSMHCVSICMCHCLILPEIVFPGIFSEDLIKCETCIGSWELNKTGIHCGGKMTEVKLNFSTWHSKDDYNLFCGYSKY